jgi:hypothetical protein
MRVGAFLHQWNASCKDESNGLDECATRIAIWYLPAVDMATTCDACVHGFLPGGVERRVSRDYDSRNGHVAGPDTDTETERPAHVAAVQLSQ